MFFDFQYLGVVVDPLSVVVLQEDSEGSDLYAVPVKRRQRKAEELPPGWEKHEVS